VDKWSVVGKGAVLGTQEPVEPNRRNPDHLAGGLVVVGRDAFVPAGTVVGGNVIIHPRVRPADFPSATVAHGETIVPAK
jgi:glucose-1-phosphate adenylyltransferase